MSCVVCVSSVSQCLLGFRHVMYDKKIVNLFLLDEFNSLWQAFCSGVDLEQHTGKTGIVELKVTFVIELQKSRAIRVLLLQVQVVDFRLFGSVATIFADIDL